MISWRVPQMKNFLGTWDQHWDHVRKKTNKDNENAVPETKY
jgi:hypothetical protein